MQSPPDTAAPQDPEQLTQEEIALLREINQSLLRVEATLTVLAEAMTSIGTQEEDPGFIR